MPYSIGDQGVHLITYRVSSIYFRSIQSIAYNLPSICEASSRPWGSSARLAMSCTAFRTVGGSSVRRCSISPKAQNSRIYFLPWLIWAKEHKSRVLASLTDFAGSVIQVLSCLICPLNTMAALPSLLKEILLRVIHTWYLIWILALSTYCLGWSRRPIRRLMISVLRARGVPASPCIRILSNSTVFTRI